MCVILERAANLPEPHVLSSPRLPRVVKTRHPPGPLILRQKNDHQIPKPASHHRPRPSPTSLPSRRHKMLAQNRSSTFQCRVKAPLRRKVLPVENAQSRLRKVELSLPSRLPPQSAPKTPCPTSAARNHPCIHPIASSVNSNAAFWSADYADCADSAGREPRKNQTKVS